MSNCGNCSDDEIIVLPAGKAGDKGDTGNTGAAGVDGSDGALWFSGSTSPLDSLGSDGDLYLDTTTGEIYQKAGGTWGSSIMTVTGVTGLNGADGLSFINGVGVPGAGLGNNGDTYVDLGSPDLDIYTKSGGIWTDTGLGLKGATGAAGSNGSNGTNGTDGTKLIQGSGAPSSGLGNDGDSYVDNASNDLYLKSTGTWVLTGNIASGGIPPGQQHLFNTSNITEQTIFADAGLGAVSAIMEFSDDTSVPHFDYGSTWITNTWTSPGTLSNVTFGVVLDIETAIAATGGANRTVIVEFLKNGVLFNTITNDFAGAIIGTIKNYTGVSAVQSFVLGDLVTCRIKSAMSTPEGWSGNTLVDGIFYNVQN